MITFDRNQKDWGSIRLYPDGTLPPFTMDKIVIHWGGSTNPGSGEVNEAAVLRAWQRNHLAKKPHPWTDIAYGFAFGNSSLVYRCRGFNRQAATSGDYDGDGIPENEEAISLVWIGGSGYTPSPGAYASMGRVIRELLAFDSTLIITVHSDHKATRCPGDLWRQWVAEESWKEGDDMSNGFLRIFYKWTPKDLDAMKAAGYWKGVTSYYYGPKVTDEERINLTIHILANGNKDIPIR